MNIITMPIYLNIHLENGIMNKLLIVFVHIFLLSQNDGWKQIHNSREYSISGIANFNDGYLVVHDNKKKNQARVSYINRELKIKKLIWPEPKLPYDLESAVKMPGKMNRYIFMGSKGICYEVTVDPKDFRIDVLHTFTLPGLKPKMNLEGLTIYPSGQGLIFIYGNRGSDSETSTLFTVFFNHKKKLFKDLNQFEYDLPIPKKHKRNFADLTLKEDGSIWTVATSDPGNNGPFTSAIYELGEINHAGTFIPIHPNLLKPIMVFSGQKVEAMVFHKGHLVLMTDNENFGSTFKLME